MKDYAKSLRDRIAQGGVVAVPGAPDVLTARLIAQCGFEAVYMTGLGATASRLGTPDLGLLSQTEMADQARSMAAVAGVPVIADADTGYGGPLNLRRVVEDYARAGIAAFHVEDQQMPKRCGQLSGARLVTPREAEARLRAAVAARDASGHGMLVIGRTDALGVDGMNAALERARRYADTGVDLVFIDGIQTVEQVEKVAEGLAGPKVVSIVDGTDAARLGLDEISRMGFTLCLYALTTLLAGLSAQAAALAHLRETGGLRTNPDGFDYARFSGLVDLAGHQAFAHEFET
ncbi:PEP phosphonomutase-like enzyme [Rhizobium leguminosarum bv. trifolii WSM2297]|uniref:PEP phosphonomutase-like enzyme n=1 Tax=Rhizobium leguminosarum bv. trifolii WSM2297 TaxID=754762 RepID=J0KTT7_RHILT|nr:isocitrate lyase/PEP mutase family protein [Rhizobium leguminosarum]EJC81069.1 PEP phosphonomutase-like enzyme [Rhizobium leguminosarum bv. trifolii WSM2297]